MAAARTMSCVKKMIQTLRRFIKKPWEITGPCSHPEYRSSLPSPLEYRVPCPASAKQEAIVPTSLPHTVFDIKYFTRDPTIRPPLRRMVLRKVDVVKLIQDKTFHISHFPRVYLTPKVEQHPDALGGGYQS